jgi:hypothetical protein
MLKKMTLVLGLVALCGFATVAQAKDLTNRLGVGVKKNTALDLAELATVYYPSSEIGFAGGLGIDTQKDASKFSANAAVRRIVFKENNMNFYMGGSLGLVNFETSAKKQSGFELNALFGGEFFLTGLDSLGFTFEGGVGVVSADEVRFRTLADGPFSAGIIFYF